MVTSAKMLMLRPLARTRSAARSIPQPDLDASRRAMRRLGSDGISTDQSAKGSALNPDAQSASPGPKDKRQWSPTW